MAVAYVAGLSGTGGWIHVATPQFLSKALGKPQAGAKLVRHPGHGTTLRMGGSSFGISHGDVSFGLAAQGVGSAPWAAYANGVGRPTPFGLETVTANRTQAEQFLTVGRHYGPTTWHWKFGNLPNGVTPRVGDDGYVAFLVQSGSIKQLSQDAFIAPPAILDSHGNRIPQHNLHWTVSSVHGQWWLNLHVDDSHLPTPYVIDPIAMRGTATSSQTSAGTSLVLTAPTGVVANDVMIAQVTTRNNAAISNSAGLTFTQIGSTVTNTANLEQAIYQRVATGSEGGSTATFSWSTGSADATGGILAFSSVNTGVPVDVSTSNTGTTSGTAGTNPCSGTCKATASAVTTNFANDEILVFYGSMGTDNSTAITVTQDSGQNVTQDYTVISTSNKTSRSDSTAAAGTSVQAAAGSTGIFTATLNLGGTPWIAHTVALKPGVATKLAVTSVPANATAGANFSVTVQSQDASGNCTPVNQATGISLASDGTGTLSGNTASISVGTCSVTLSSVQYTKTGTIHLTASRTSGDTLTTSAASSAIVFAAGPVDATQSTLTPTSASITANGSATQVLTVQAKDANGNNLASGGLTVTITKQSGTGSISSVTDNGNGTYTATVTAPSATGSGVFVATLGGNPVKSGGGSQTTSTITYVAGSADATASTLTPTSASITANGTATQVLTVQAKDATGNNLTSGGSTVTITKQSGTGSIGSVTDNGNGTYTATVTAPSATGSGVFVATLGGNPVKSGTGSQAQATVTYAPGTATQLVFGQQPSNTVAGVTMSPAVTVKVEDASGNVVTGDNSTQVALAILNNPSSGTLTGGAATTVSSGIATFSGLSIDKTGVGYTLQATKSGLTSATSNSFNITARTSSVSVSCATNPVTYGGSTLCTATVSDSQGSGTSSTPGGSVAFGTNGSGSFTSSGTCTLSSGSCAVTYTPTAVGTGTHQITATYTSTDGIHGGSNNNTSVTVNKASLTVTPDPQSRTYGQAAPTYTFSVTGFQNGETAGTASGYVAPSCTSDYTTTTNVAASPRTISCSGGSANNYSFNTSATANLTVTKASLTVTPDPQSRTYGQAAPSYTFSVTGFQNGQTAGTASGYVAPSC
ncbi:MAG: hypothetical protein QOG85_585, partial [Gaiellaceae bacterium]|nr:hypothetical protein [Gaiellaceae bacterium]